MPLPSCTTADFPILGWHDCPVHALWIVEGDDNTGTGELILDLDYILEWINRGDVFHFRIAPAVLRFHEVSDLRIELDYSGWAFGPFPLDGIEREPVTCPNGHTSFRWILYVNWPGGRISFDSPGFTQRLTGPAIVVDRQALRASERIQLPER